jgi:hypothetical protein
MSRKKNLGILLIPSAIILLIYSWYIQPILTGYNPGMTVQTNLAQLGIQLSYLCSVISVVMIISGIVLIIRERRKPLKKYEVVESLIPLREPEKDIKIPLSSKALPSKAYQGKEPYIFISYSHKDSDLVYPQIQWMHNLGFNIWYDEGIPPTSEWPTEIENALQMCKLFIVFITKNAVESINVRNEINFALDIHKKFLYIFLKDTTLKYGLRLRMGTLQNIKSYELEPSRYYEKLLGTLNTILQ